MTEAAPPEVRAAAPRAVSIRFVAAEGIGLRIVVAVVLSLLSSAALVALSGHNPLVAFAALAMGAAGSPHQLGVALNRATPYLLAGTGVAFCFRAGIINIGAEGQIALGGLGAAAVALHWPQYASWAVAPASLIGAAIFGALWSAIATAIHLKRRVHEVLVTLLLNFVGALIVQEALAGPLGQAGAGFLQSPIMPRGAWLWRLLGLDAHVGFILALAAAAALSVTLWLTPFGFAIRVAGRSRRAAAYAGFSIGRLTWAAMLLSGALAGLAGGVEVLGIHHRLIEGFSLGFGFKAVTVALLGAVEPLAVAPAALFVGSARGWLAFDAAADRRALRPCRGDRRPHHAVHPRSDGETGVIEFLEAAIRIATPLMLAALGGILSERAGVFAVGLEGMMLMGAFGGAIGAWATGSALVGVALAILSGAAIGLVVAVVTVAYRADNMVTGLTANILAAGLTSYLMRVLSGGVARSPST